MVGRHPEADGCCRAVAGGAKASATNSPGAPRSSTSREMLQLPLAPRRRAVIERTRAGETATHLLTCAACGVVKVRGLGDCGGL